MNPTGVQPQPAGVDTELSDLLSSRGWARQRASATRSVRLPLDLALEELNLWLVDPRPYDRRHADSWKSMTVDALDSLAARGTQLRQATPTLTALATALRNSAPGPHLRVRADCLAMSQSGLAELAASAGITAAFDDVLNVVLNPDESLALVLDRVEILAGALEAADRSAHELVELAEVLDDSLSQIQLSRHLLDETPLPTEWDHEAKAGLTTDERIQMCRRLLDHGSTHGHYVIWLAYEQAKFGRDILAAGPITIFNGPAFVSGQIGSVDKDAVLAALHRDDHESFYENWPPGDDWVAVKVDLGTGRFADPLKTAEDQADALILLAALHTKGTSWKRSPHSLSIIDGLERQRGWGFGTNQQQVKFLTDKTQEVLKQLAPHVAPHLPVTSRDLRTLLDLVAALPDEEEEDPATTLTQSVRIVEAIAGRHGLGDWKTYLMGNRAPEWAAGRALFDIANAVDAAMHCHDLQDLTEMPDPDPTPPGQPRPRDGWIQPARAHSALTNLALRIPDHHRVAREVRSASRIAQDAASFDQSLDQFHQDYQVLVERVRRYRNALAHGGPFLDKAATIICAFARQEAGNTAHITLWAVIQGRDPFQALTETGQRLRAWRANSGSFATVTDAIADIERLEDPEDSP